MVKDLPGVILAAGKGERLRSGVPGVPKPLVELGGEALIVRQARAMLAAGARPVLAMVNSETAHLARERSIVLPPEVTLLVRDTANSMETLFALADRIERRRFLAATVDAVLPQQEFKRFGEAAREMCARDGLGGALGVVRWRGETKPLFAEIGADGLVRSFGAASASHITAGVYLLSTNIFRFVAEARRVGLQALREFLALLLAKGVRLGAIELSDAVDIDEAADLAAAAAKLEQWTRGNMSPSDRDPR
jgi:choline kinase